VIRIQVQDDETTTRAQQTEGCSELLASKPQHAKPPEVQQQMCGQFMKMRCMLASKAE
jgi:hypothetical protein